jgi:hypothetical protein
MRSGVSPLPCARQQARAQSLRWRRLAVSNEHKRWGAARAGAHRSEVDWRAHSARPGTPGRASARAPFRCSPQPSTSRLLRRAMSAGPPYPSASGPSPTGLCLPRSLAAAARQRAWTAWALGGRRAELPGPLAREALAARSSPSTSLGDDLAAPAPRPGHSSLSRAAPLRPTGAG